MGKMQKVSPKVSLDQSIDEKVSPNNNDNDNNGDLLLIFKKKFGMLIYDRLNAISVTVGLIKICQ